MEPALELLRGSAFLAVNDEYVEFADTITLKVWCTSLDTYPCSDVHP